MNHNLKILFLILGMVLFSQSFSATASEAPAEEWNLSMGAALDNSDNNDNFRYALQTSDSEYIIVGIISSNSNGTKGYPDVWLVKLDENGNFQWNKSYGGSYFDEGYYVKQTSDGGYALSGYTFPSGYAESWLIKTDANGNKIWDKVSDEISIKDNIEYIAEKTNDGGYVSVDTVEYEIPDNNSFELWVDTDIRLTKYDSDAIQKWNKTFTQEMNFEMVGFRPVRQTNDGGYLIAGTTFDKKELNMDILLAKTDEFGNEEWNKTYGGPMSDFAFCVSLTSDNGYILAGAYNGTQLFDPYGSAFILKTDSNGNQEWIKEFSNSTLYSVEQTSDNGYIAAGTKDGRAWVVKLEGDKTVSDDSNVFHKLLNYIYSFF